MILACVGLVWISGSWGIADRNAYQAKQLEKEWREQGKLSEVKLRQAVSLVESAVNLAPSNPEYRDQLARLLMLDFLLNRDESALSVARGHLLESRTSRPHWPGNWALFIDLKFHLNEPDEEMSNTIVNAMSIGPREPAVIQSVVRAGVKYHDQLTPPARESLYIATMHGLESPVSGLSSTTFKLMQEGARFWSLGLVNGTIVHLLEWDWTKRNGPQFASLALTWWSIFGQGEKQQVAIKIADLVEHSVPELINRQPASVRLLLCTHMTKATREKAKC